MGVRNVFIYNTKNPHLEGHIRFREATVTGRLYKIDPITPILVVPQSTVVAVGSGNHEMDVVCSRNWQEVRKFVFPTAKGKNAKGGGYWIRIRGGIYTFDDLTKRLPLLDESQGFYPGERGRVSVYTRAMIPAFFRDDGSTKERPKLASVSLLPVWAYVSIGHAAGLCSSENLIREDSWSQDEGTL